MSITRKQFKRTLWSAKIQNPSAYQQLEPNNQTRTTQATRRKREGGELEEPDNMQSRKRNNFMWFQTWFSPTQTEMSELNLVLSFNTWFAHALQPNLLAKNVIANSHDNAALQLSDMQACKRFIYKLYCSNVTSNPTYGNHLETFHSHRSIQLTCIISKLLKT